MSIAAGIVQNRWPNLVTRLAAALRSSFAANDEHKAYVLVVDGRSRGALWRRGEAFELSLADDAPTALTALAGFRFADLAAARLAISRVLHAPGPAARIALISVPL